MLAIEAKPSAYRSHAGHRPAMAARAPQIAAHKPPQHAALHRHAARPHPQQHFRPHPRTLARCGDDCACSGCSMNHLLERAVQDRAAATLKNHDSAARDTVNVMELFEAMFGAPAQAATPAEGLQAPHWADNARLQQAVRNSPSLKSGSQGEPVRLLQVALVSQGFPMPGSTKPSGKMDGIWGQETTAAVRAFQEREAINPPGGWEVGRKTLGRMDVLLLASPPGPVPVPACPTGNAATKMTACVQPIVIADDDGKNPTKAPSMDQVVSIWDKCCIDYTVKPTQTVKKKDFKTLDESPNDTPTAEETQLFADAGSSDCIQVFVPVQFAQGGKKGKSISGGGATYDGGSAHPKIVVVEGAKPEVVAHEVGHASGHGDHDENPTVMKPTGAHNKANKRAVSLGVCSAARTGPCLTNAASDCCQNPK